LRRKGLQRSQEFSWRRAAQETLDVYRYAVRHAARATAFDPAFIPGPQ
jgi:hypothetical protein